jgi:hypothetical protein
VGAESDLAPGVRVTAKLHVLPTDEPVYAATGRNPIIFKSPMDKSVTCRSAIRQISTDHHFDLVLPDEDDVEVPVILGHLILVLGDDPGLGVDPRESALLLLLAVGRRRHTRRLEGRGAVRAVLLAVGELLGGLPASQLLLQPPPRYLARVLPLYLPV